MLGFIKDALSLRLIRFFSDSATARTISTTANKDIQMRLQENALNSTAMYVEEYMIQAKTVTSVTELLHFALSQVVLEGLFLEFGVAEGNTANCIAEKIGQNVLHGFDSFAGLPEFWVEIMDTRYEKGTFDLQGQLPKVRNNVELHVGWFDQTLPSFIGAHPQAVAFVHIDCDLYSSTKCIFDQLGDHIKPGTIIAFNEYFNYPSWQKHEHKAFQELVAECNLRYVKILDAQ
jgi:Methyltransferase domain